MGLEWCYVRINPSRSRRLALEFPLEPFCGGKKKEKSLLVELLCGHRRYDIYELLGNYSDATLTVGYARVSSHDQKQDLERQSQVLEAYCAKHGWSFEIIQDLGSGMNYRKRGLIQLIKLVTSHQVERLVLTHKDRLLRFGAELIFCLCEQFGTEVIIINCSEDSSFEEDLAQDVLEIITVFCARLYGSFASK